ncbi:hypothetical protein Hanom_Chr14g01323301 [Helianthus anomalus]
MTRFSFNFSFNRVQIHDDLKLIINIFGSSKSNVEFLEIDGYKLFHNSSNLFSYSACCNQKYRNVIITFNMCTS